MKFSASIFVLAVALVNIGSMSATMAGETYKTKSDQVVVTGLKAQKKYQVKYVTAQGRTGQRKINSNSCGQALINKAGKFQSMTIDGQSIDPTTLKVKEHKRCNSRKINIRLPINPQPTASPANN